MKKRLLATLLAAITVFTSITMPARAEVPADDYAVGTEKAEELSETEVYVTEDEGCADEIEEEDAGQEEAAIVENQSADVTPTFIPEDSTDENEEYLELDDDLTLEEDLELSEDEEESFIEEEFEALEDVDSFDVAETVYTIGGKSYRLSLAEDYEDYGYIKIYYFDNYKVGILTGTARSNYLPGRTQPLEYLDCSTLDTSQLTDMSEMFSGYRYLKEINLSSFDTSNVTSMEEMFTECESLTSLDVILSIMVDTFISKIFVPMLHPSKHHSIAYV